MAPKIARPSGDTAARSQSIARSASIPAQVHRATVVTVNRRDYTVDARMESYPYSAKFDLPFMVPYVHQANGEGINFMPEVGSTCWICSPSEEGRDSFVLGWTTVDEGGTYRGGRPLLNDGDQHFSTRDGNFVTIRRGGIVQIGSTPICQRIFIPLRNIIRDIAENYELSTPAGDMKWEVLRTDEQGDGHRGCVYTLAAKEFSDDPNKDPIAFLKIGSHGEGNETILTLQTRDKGGGTIKTKLEVFKDGSLKWAVEKDITIEVKGNHKTTVKGTMTATSDQDMSLESKTKLAGKAPVVTMNGGGAKLDLAGSAALNGSVVNLGDAAHPAMALNPSMAAWIGQVTAMLGALPPGTPVVSAPLIPPLPTSTKVKV